jgi:hypothetical protein
MYIEPFVEIKEVKGKVNLYLAKGNNFNFVKYKKR